MTIFSILKLLIIGHILHTRLCLYCSEEPAQNHTNILKNTCTLRDRLPQNTEQMI